MKHAFALVRQMIFNPPITWNNPTTGTPEYVEKWTRREYWNSMRPLWTYTLFAKRHDCGCATRLNYHTLWCMKHAFAKAGVEVPDVHE